MLGVPMAKLGSARELKSHLPTANGQHLWLDTLVTTLAWESGSARHGNSHGQNDKQAESLVRAGHERAFGTRCRGQGGNFLCKCIIAYAKEWFHTMIPSSGLLRLAVPHPPSAQCALVSGFAMPGYSPPVWKVESGNVD